MDLEMAVRLVNTPWASDEYIRRTYGNRMRQLVSRLRTLPTWERIRPTTELAKREWRKIQERDRLRMRRYRLAQRTQRRLD